MNNKKKRVKLRSAAILLGLKRRTTISARDDTLVVIVNQIAGVRSGMDGPHPLAKDSKYKKFVTEVDRALKAFENTNEWADLISALGKLAKVFSSNSKYHDIPKAVTVAKRLSQCLHPALPMGVHLKALETYKQIFDILGRDALPKQMYLFAVGLFPLMDHCGIKVKGELLTIFEEYLLPLGERLRPSLPGFLAGVLLGLEEGTEYFDRSFSLLDKVCDTVGAAPFYACLWQTVLGSPAVRLPALLYVNAKFDKTRSVDDQSYIVGDHVNHMVAALCAAGEDMGSPLVQRNLLDLLCAAFALDSTSLTREDFVQLLRRCLFVVLRRDMSLNRRLFTWILNPTGVSTAVSSVPVGDDQIDTSFFTQTSLPMIVDALKEFLQLDTVEIQVASSSLFSASTAIGTGTLTHKDDTQQFVEVRVSRLLTYLQDRPEVGRPVLIRVLPLLLINCSRLLNDDDDETNEESNTKRRMSVVQRPRALQLSQFNHDCNAAGETAEKLEEKTRQLVRRREEVSKNLNVLVHAVDEDGAFLWEFMGEWFQRILSSFDGSKAEGKENEENGEGKEWSQHLPRLSHAQAEVEMAVFPKVVAYVLSVAQLNSTAAVRSRHLPRLLKKLLSRTKRVAMKEEHNQMVLSTVQMAVRLLGEIAKASGSRDGDEVTSAEDDARLTCSPQKSAIGDGIAELVDEEAQTLMEECMEESQELLEGICRYYCEDRAPSRWPLLHSACSLLSTFADLPFYCVASSVYNEKKPKQLPEWVEAMLQVMDIDSWLRELSSNGAPYDFEPRATCLETLVRLAIRCTSVVGQHAAVEGRRPARESVSSAPTTVLLKPLLHAGHLITIEERGVFDRCGAAAWAAAGTEWPRHQAHASQLVALLHSRRPNEPSSPVEQAIVSALTSPDTVVSTEAARTFHRIWTLTRSGEELGQDIVIKPFNRVVMLLLGVLADDSVSFEKVELRSVATAWFVDCARHNDLPTIIQMLAMMLMSPATARVSIQYVKQENKLTRAEMPSLPMGAQAVTLVTADQKQRLHHLVTDEDHTGIPSTPGIPQHLHHSAHIQSHSSSHSTSPSTSSGWYAELRSRLLLCASKEANEGLFAVERPHNDIPNFDEEETDSLDTLSISLESGIDPVVAETLQWIIDCVVDEEESELQTQRRFDAATAKMLFGRGDGNEDTVSESSTHTAAGMTVEEVAMAERAAAVAAAVAAGTAPLPPPGPSCPVPPSSLPLTASNAPLESISWIRKGHRRQDSLAETIFNSDLRLFDAADILKQPTHPPLRESNTLGTVTSTSSTESREGINMMTATTSSSSQLLYTDLHAHMLLYAESGRVVDLGRAETGFRILTALLRPRCAPVPASILLHCLVSSVATNGNASSIIQTNDGSTGPSSLLELMSRHVRAILGQQFWAMAKESGGNETEDTRTRNLTLLELLITISLHFLRSYFLNSPIAPVTFSDLITSWKCKIAVLELLTELMRELAAMLQAQQSRTFVNFVQSILGRSKLQKCLLLLLVSSVHDPRKGEGENCDMQLSMLVAEFNEGKRSGGRGRNRLSGLVSAYNRALLSLTAANIRLEFELKHGFSAFGDQMSNSTSSLSRLPHIYGGGNISASIGNAANNRTMLREMPASLVELRVFLLTVLNALKSCPSRHESWLQLVVHILPWLDRALPKFCMRVTDQLCKNVETSLATAYSVEGGERREEIDQGLISPTPSPDAESGASGHELGSEFPANFVVMSLETLTTVIHFCVVDTSSAAGVGSIVGGGMGTAPCTPASVTTNNALAQSTPSMSTSTSMMGQALAAVPGTRGATELFTNLVKVFSFGENSSNVPLKLDQRTAASSWKQARSELLAGLPHALATICDVWSVVESGRMPLKPVGTPQQLGHLVLDLLSPIAQLHQQHFLAALALVWLTRGDPREREMDRPTFNYSPAQLDITSLLLNLEVIPFETLVAAIGESLKDSASKGVSTGGKGGTMSNTFHEKPAASFPTEAPLLELLHSCVRSLDASELAPAWPSIHSLIAEAPLTALPSRAVFLLFIILCDYVRVCAPCGGIVEERMKVVVKQVQECTQRLVEACNVIVGWQLETTTWLKRTLVVKHDQGGGGGRSTDSTPSLEVAPSLGSATPAGGSIVSGVNNMDASHRTSTASLTSTKPPTNDTSSAQFSLKSSGSNLRASVKDTNNNKRDPAESTRALFLLAENLAELVDSVCRSDEKERLLPVLHAVWMNVVPYLKAKNARNSRFFLASSQLLAAMSSYSYMRPVWRKTTMDLLLDPTFFKMDVHSLRQWLVVTDHLMTHDKTSFRDLLRSISSPPQASFSSLMTSKEQEHDARSQSLKRLAFIVLGSELDQYRPQLPDIQERLAENLRLCQAVPSIRASVFLCYRVLLLRLNPTSLVSMWPAMVTELVHVLLQVEQQLVGGSDEELASAKDDHWMQLYLAACKLLESLCTLPAGYLAQFQMCHWAFVSTVSTTGAETFVPFAERIHKLLQEKYRPLSREEIATSSASLANMKIITGFEELRPFFFALANTNKAHGGAAFRVELRDASVLAGSLSQRSAMQRLEHALYVDFAEHWQL